MAKINGKFDISEKAKKRLISELTDELIFLRTKLGLSQDEMSNLLGISRQTYSTLETKKRVMSWGTYLSLILIFDNNEQTHDLVRDVRIFPYMLFRAPDVEANTDDLHNVPGLMIDDIKYKLDERALHSIETVIRLEYARCNNMSGEDVIKAFDGRQFMKISQQDHEISKIMNSIKKNDEE